MALFKSGNPALNKETFSHCETSLDEADVMTIDGTVNKTAFLLLLTIVSAILTWRFFSVTANYGLIGKCVLISSIVGVIIAFFVSFNKDLSALLTPIYAFFEGIALGGISLVMEQAYPGIVNQSLLLTFSIFIVLLVIYKAKLIAVTENLKLIIASATAGIAFYYLLSLVFRLVGVQLPLIHESTVGGIFFSVFVVIIAAMNLVVDFDFIEQGAASHVPKYMEWYGAFGLLVTVIWLYVEILRLLGKSRRK